MGDDPRERAAASPGDYGQPSALDSRTRSPEIDQPPDAGRPQRV